MNKNPVKQCYIVFITNVNTELRNLEEIEKKCSQIQTADSNNISKFCWCCFTISLSEIVDVFLPSDVILV